MGNLLRVERLLESLERHQTKEHVKTRSRNGRLHRDP